MKMGKIVEGSELSHCSGPEEPEIYEVTKVCDSVTATAAYDTPPRQGIKVSLSGRLTPLLANNLWLNVILT